MAFSMKIPCSVSIITLNVEKELPRCLDNLKDFQEIIICDGNSTDRTRDIAIAAGANVICQYDTDEPETRCAMDKAAVRQRAMDASTLPWRFFMDADDTLSRGSIEEIRAIVINTSPKHLVYRMPTHVEIEGVGRITHQASSPGFQTRLVHESVGAVFKGDVHERLVFDEKLFPPGELRHPYIFHWSHERYKNFWQFLSAYVDRELATLSFKSLGDFLYWGWYWRVRAFVGYAFRIIKTYLQYGREGTMPLSIELATLRYHVSLFIKSTTCAVSRLFFVQFVIETIRGKDSYRFLSNRVLMGKELYGKVLDIGGGKKRGSHFRYFSLRRWHRVCTADINPDEHPDIVADISKDTLPIKTGTVDTVLCMNVLEHVADLEHTLKESHRVLRKGGVVYAVVPFFVRVHPTPSDFRRLTSEGLYKAFIDAGFICETVTPFGAGPFLAAHYQLEMILPRFVRLFTVPIMLGFDAILFTIRKKFFSVDSYPLGYFVEAKK